MNIFFFFHLAHQQCGNIGKSLVFMLPEKQWPFSVKLEVSEKFLYELKISFPFIDGKKEVLFLSLTVSSVPKNIT